MSSTRLVENSFYPVVLGGAFLLAWGMIAAGVSSAVVLVSCSVGVAVICFLVEKRFAESERWRLDPGEARTDLLHALLSNPIPTAILRAALATAVVALSGKATEWLGFALWPTGWPLPAQFVLALVSVELVSYAIHRMLHRSALWPLHAVHHCSPRMYFLLSVRKHPLQSFVTYGGRFAFIWFVGMPEDTLTLLLAFTGANSYVQHANIRMNTQPFRYVFATPELHRLHHSRRPSELDTNFGDVLIIWDLLFGTRVEPRPGDAIDGEIGLPGIEVPQTYASHLRLPFEWSALHADPGPKRR